jgi:hypothetical protein
VARQKNSVAQALAGLILIVGALLAYQLGLLDAIGRLLVNHSTSSMQREVERQKAENQKAAKPLK